MSWYVAAALILLVALASGLGLLAYAMYALLGILILSRIVARRWVDSLSVDREFNRSEASLGDTIAVVASIENTGRLPIAWALLEDLLPRHALIHNPPSLGVTGTRIRLLSLMPGHRKSMLYQLKCNRRGYFQVGPLVVESGDLFGLHRRYRIGSEPNFLTVYPKIIPLEGYDIASRRPIGEVSMSYRLFEDPTRITGVRQYQPGDPLSRVHWRATASTGVLHSKIYEPTTVAGATIVLDFHRDSHDKKDEPVRSELAVTAAVSIANALYEMQQQVGLITNGHDAADRIRHEGWAFEHRTRTAARDAASMRPDSERLAPQVVPTRRGPEQMMVIRSTLARLEMADGLTLPQLLTETNCRMPRDATIVVILRIVDELAAIALGNLARQGFAVHAILNMYDSYDYAQAAGQLLSQRVSSSHLLEEASISNIAHEIVR